MMILQDNELTMKFRWELLVALLCLSTNIITRANGQLDIRVTSVDTTSITVTWKKLLPFSDEIPYWVYVGTADQSCGFKGIHTMPPYIATNLPPGGDYKVRVCAWYANLLRYTEVIDVQTIPRKVNASAATSSNTSSSQLGLSKLNTSSNRIRWIPPTNGRYKTGIMGISATINRITLITTGRSSKRVVQPSDQMMLNRVPRKANPLTKISTRNSSARRILSLPISDYHTNARNTTKNRGIRSSGNARQTSGPGTRISAGDDGSRVGINDSGDYGSGEAITEKSETNHGFTSNKIDQNSEKVKQTSDQLPYFTELKRIAIGVGLLNVLWIGVIIILLIIIRKLKNDKTSCRKFKISKSQKFEEQIADSTFQDETKKHNYEEIVVQGGGNEIYVNEQVGQFSHFYDL